MQSVTVLRIVTALLAVQFSGSLVVAQPKQYPSESFLPKYLRQRMTERISSRRDSREITSLVQPLAVQTSLSTVEVLSKDKRVGLGTVVGSDGYVLTKASELASGESIRLRLHDDRILSAQLLSQNDSMDLALLKASVTGLTPVEFSNHEPVVGSFLISVGRLGIPIGIGVVSVKAREILDDGRLGVRLETVKEGVRVREVVRGSGAFQGGVQVGDIITRLNSTSVETDTEATALLRELYSGDTVRLTVRREGTVDLLQLTAELRELSLFSESRDDLRVNGPRNSRLAGFKMALQHDTVLGTDQCGGPVVDSNGKVVGINIARAGRVCSYAIPATALKPVLDQMLGSRRP